ncbi:MAG: hypothetical protein NTW07_13495 [candidate division Zixibacteria bacterium]|nr:hypothetical protein [candidate division Zixibacteria bacterium]
MRKVWLVLLGFGVLLVLAAVGCNDECASCPDPAVTPLGYATGWLTLNPGTIMPQLEIFGNGAVAPNLDSVKVGDSLIDREDWSMMTTAAFTDAHWVIPFSEAGDPSTYMYEHGDVATLRVWGSGRSGTCELKILNYTTAAANITSPAPLADSIAPGVADTIFWNRVEYADYYAIMIAWLVSEGGGTHWTFTYHYATDTSFIVTGAMQLDSAIRYDFVVSPFTGPNPRTGRTNWTGTLLGGVVYSAGQYDITTVVIRPLLLSSGTALSEQTEARPEVSAEEIVRNVYKQFEK